MATLTNVQMPTSAVSSEIADPAPLGLAAFALTTFVLSTVNAGLIPKASEPVVFGLATAYGGVAQFCAGMWEFKRNNVFGATVFSSYGAFWISFALLAAPLFVMNLLFPGKVTPSAIGPGIGVYLLAWAIFTTYMAYVARKHAKVLYIAFLMLTPTIFLLAFGALLGIPLLGVLGGYLGILVAFLAWYASYEILEKTG
jgi:uncharacterized protein